MYILTNEQMREADAYTIQTTPSLLLMERAGIALADEAERMWTSGKIVCVCGGGNNGGDGFVCARILKERGFSVLVYSHAERYSQDCRINREKWMASGGEIVDSLPEEVGVLVDCLYGTGFHGELKEADRTLVEGMNTLRQKGTLVLSADIPSGVNGDNGMVVGIAVKADVTLCIGGRKMGTLLGDGIDYAGVLKVVDIGITFPKDDYARLITRSDVKESFPVRRRNSHKGSYGKTAIVAGSLEYTGAVYLSTLACLRSGVGYTTVFVPSALLPHLYFKCPEAILKSTNDGGMYAFTEENMQTLTRFDSVAYGMGMGCTEEVAKGAEWLLTNYTGKLILDADALNSLAKYRAGRVIELLKNKTCDVLLTPHVKEFSRLSGHSMEEIRANAIALAKGFAKEGNFSLLLKNAVSIVTDGQKVFLNETGCSGQAKGGSGDVLSGLIAGLCAMGLSTLESAKVGCYLFGKAGELASREFGEYSLTPTDVIAYLGRAFLFVLE